MDQLTGAIIAAVGSGIISSLATIAAIRVELRWLRRDVDRLNKRVFPSGHVPFDSNSLRS